MTHTRFLLPVLLLAAISCASEAETRKEASPPPRLNLAWFASPSGIITVDLDSGHLEKGLAGKPVIPYLANPFGNGKQILTYVDWNLECGFSIHEAFGTQKARLHGYSAYALGNGAFLGVMVSEVLEDSAGSSAAALVQAYPAVTIEKLENTIPLSPEAIMLGGSQSALPLLMSYQPRPALTDYHYRWQRDFTFAAIDAAATKLWSSEVTVSELAVDMEFLGDCAGVLVLFARFDYTFGEFIGLDAKSGKVLWKRVTNIFPIARNDYPFADFAYLLPMEVDNGVASFPAYDTRGGGRQRAMLSLLTSDISLKEDAAWLRRADTAWLAEQVRPEPTGLRTWDIGDEEKLVVGGGKLKLLQAGGVVWEHELLPHYGQGLELERAGEKFLLLVEKPARPGRQFAQGITHLVDRASGKELLAELEAEAQHFQPLMVGKKALLLFPEGSRLYSPPA